MAQFKHSAVVTQARTFRPDDPAFQREGLCERALQGAVHYRCDGPARVIVPSYGPAGWYECDVAVITASGLLNEYEIKCNGADFRRDFKDKPEKHRRLEKRDQHDAGLPSRFIYVCPPLVIEPADLPDYAGLLYAYWQEPDEYTGYACPSPLLAVVKRGPLLTRRRVPPDIVKAMFRGCYYRFWNERRRYDDLKKRQACLV